MKRRAALTTAMTSLLLLAIPLAAVAAPTYRERYKCYEPCRAHCADRYSCENRNATRNCFTNFNKCKSVAGPVVITSACDHRPAPPNPLRQEVAKRCGCFAISDPTPCSDVCQNQPTDDVPSSDGHDHRPLQVRAVVTPLGRRVAIVLGYMTAVLIAMLVVEALVDLWRYLR